MNYYEEFNILSDEEDYQPPEYHSTLSENVLFEIEDSSVIYPALWVHQVWATDGSDDSGLVSCEQDHGCLDYLIKETMINNPRKGYYVIENAGVDYIRGDWGFTYDTIKFYYDVLRPARIYEIIEAGESYKVAWKVLPRQLWLHFLYLWGYEL